MPTLQSLARDLGGLAVVAALLVSVTFLPPDTSLSEVRANDAITACVPRHYPPLVTGDPERPGIDIELLRAVADDLGVRLLLNPNDAMGRDFNPRNWAINRGKCQILAGGVVDSRLTRSFLDIGPPYAETGWAILAPAPIGDMRGLTLGALTLVSGLDRIGLSSYLRSQDVTVRVVPDPQSLVDGIASGAFDGGVTEALLARGIAAEHGWWIAAPPDGLARRRLVFGLWKGDLTLKREIVGAFRRLERSGTLGDILRRYGVTPLAEDGMIAELQGAITSPGSPPR